MRARGGWSLVELLVVAAVVALLAAILLPCLGAARELSRLTSCAAQMRGIGAGLAAYAAGAEQHLPAFAFADPAAPSLGAAGHWGGASQPGDPAAFGRLGVDCVNLQPLVRGGHAAAGGLICPGALDEVVAGGASYFPHTRRFSTYCLRFPTGRDLFSAAPHTWQRYGMGIYARAAGGQLSPPGTCPPGVAQERVPRVRLDRRYRLPARTGGGHYDVAADVLLADTFWFRDMTEPAPQRDGLTGYPRRADWCHGDRLNVLRGDGSVRRERDDGTIAAEVAGPPTGGWPETEDAWHAATLGRIWARLDAGG